MTVNIIRTHALTQQQKEEILHLWNKEYPVQLSLLSVQELEHYLFPLAKPVHYILEGPEAHCAGWAFAFDRNDERWFAVIVDAAVQKKGIGTALLNALKTDNGVLNGWVTDHNRYQKQDGTSYLSPELFYLKNGFSLCEQRLETEKLSAVRIIWERDQLIP